MIVFHQSYKRELTREDGFFFFFSSPLRPGSKNVYMEAPGDKWEQPIVLRSVPGGTEIPDAPVYPEPLRHAVTCDMLQHATCNSRQGDWPVLTALPYFW